MTRLALLLAGAAAFAVLATANSGGYRFGVSDQAYYLPAVALAVNPDLFPRDRQVLATQTSLMASDDVLALVSTVSGLGLPAVFFGAYVLTLALLFFSAAAFSRALGLSAWATAAALLLLTLRHRITKTGANSLEGYMHPRQLAFACGVLAWVCFVRGRPALALATAAIAGLVHPTTGLWFGAALLVALVIQHRDRRGVLVWSALASCGAAVWALVWGPLSGRLAVMDETWLAVLADKDYLFPAAWPLYAWAANLGSAALVGAIFLARRRSGAAGDAERALAVGLLVLVVGFLLSVPLTEARLALAVQLQVNRVFWLIDFVLAIYVAWWIVGGPSPRGSRRRAVIVVAALALVAGGRGAFLLTVTHADRTLAALDLAESPWTDAMRWIGRQPDTWHVLADPGHAWKYGASVRAAAFRDTVLEAGKDASMAMYDRDVAMRVRDRTEALAGFEQLTTEDIRKLDERYGLDVVVVEASRRLALPVIYSNAGFVVHDLR